MVVKLRARKQNNHGLGSGCDSNLRLGVKYLIWISKNKVHYIYMYVLGVNHTI